MPDENQLVQNATHHMHYNYTGMYNGFDTLKGNLYEDYGKDYSARGSQVTFAVVFGVLFSGVTGETHCFVHRLDSSRIHRLQYCRMF